MEMVVSRLFVPMNLTGSPRLVSFFQDTLVDVVCQGQDETVVTAVLVLPAVLSGLSPAVFRCCPAHFVVDTQAIPFYSLFIIS